MQNPWRSISYVINKSGKLILKVISFHFQCFCGSTEDVEKIPPKKQTNPWSDIISHLYEIFPDSLNELTLFLAAWAVLIVNINEEKHVKEKIANEQVDKTI